MMDLFFRSNDKQLITLVYIKNTDLDHLILALFKFIVSNILPFVESFSLFFFFFFASKITTRVLPAQALHIVCRSTSQA